MKKFNSLPVGGFGSVGPVGPVGPEGPVGPAGPMGAIPYRSIYFPAELIDPGITNGTTRSSHEAPNSLLTIEAHEYVHTADKFAYFAFPPHCYDWIDWANPQFKLALFYFTKVAFTGLKFVMEASIGNAQVSTRLDSTSMWTTSFQKTFHPYDFWDFGAGNVISAGDEAEAIALSTVNYDPLSLTTPNGLFIRLARKPLVAADTFNNSIFLIGAQLQFKVNLANIVQWGTLP